MGLMKLEHLIEAYKYKEIKAELAKQEGKTGVIKFNEHIYATYYEDDEIVKSIQVFASTTVKKATATIQVQHTIDLLNVIAKTMDLLTNTAEKERNIILETLGLFNGTFKEGKQVKHNGYGYKIEIAEGLILFTIGEISNEEDN